MKMETLMLVMVMNLNIIFIQVNGLKDTHLQKVAENQLIIH